MREDRVIESMKEQLKKGYLKLAILYILLKGPAHGYEMLKKIRENTLGLISPTAGSLYPALRDLEKNGFIEGEWCGERRKVKVYRITGKGREIFREVMEKHLNLASAIRKWLIDQIVQIHPIKDFDTSSGLLHRLIKMLLSGDEVSQEEKIEFLKDFREYLREVDMIIGNLIVNIEERIRELEQALQVK